MREEFEELERQNTQEITNLLEGYTALSGRQVYKIKDNNITNTIKYKARGNRQVPSQRGRGGYRLADQQSRDRVSQVVVTSKNNTVAVPEAVF